MIQILAIREFYSEKQKKQIKAEVWFDKGIRAPSVEAIFADPYSIFADKVLPSERWNMYYTVAECLEQKGRQLLKQHHIPFDIDKIEVTIKKDGTIDYEPLIFMAKIACEAIGVNYEECGILFSGGGVQIIVGTTNTITSDTYFDEVRHHFKAICDRITLRIMQAGLKGEADHSVWSPARLMRMPMTENRKPDRQPRQSHILNATIVRTDFDLRKASGLPDVPTHEQISSALADSFPTPDVKEVMHADRGCKFLTWAANFPEKVSESEWYAQLSIVGRFPDGRKLAHKMSEGHPGYSYAEADQKITQALESSGPRTCKNINGVSGGKCQGCKHNGTKLVSPLLIEGEDHVKTAKQGFHNFFLGEDGKIKKGKPDIEGLQKWFRRENKYRSVMSASVIYLWNGTHYEEYEKDRLLQYAQEHFDPKPNKAIREEFFEFVRLQDMVKADWFADSIQGKMNFKNGVFDVKSGVLVPHSMEYGFRAVLPCDYDPNAKAPRFEQFIGEVTQNRESLIHILQEFLGYIFANDGCKYEKVLILLGTGSNGKSKFIELVRALASKQGFSSLSVKDMLNDQNRYLMEGKIVNIAEENSKDAFKETELIKNFASGGEIRVKRLYSQPYEYQNRTKLIMSCNKAPNSSDDTYGFYRRLLFVPFDADFTDELGNKDVNLLDKMLAELPGIFNWIMEGYLRLNKQAKFTQSDESKRALLKYQSDTNSIMAWANDYIEFEPTGQAHVNRQEIYNDYVSFCEQQKLMIQPANRVYDYLRLYVKQHKGSLKEQKLANGKTRYWTINHIKCLSAVTK
jgi:P4 family phage/plasmid primase-like protien